MDPVVLIAGLVAASTPILLAAMGELVVERAGVLNLGVEGMMIIGAVCGFIVAYSLQTVDCQSWLCTAATSPFWGFVAAALGGAALSLIFAFLTQYLMSNQVATGLALTLFGLGLSSLLGQSYEGNRGPVIQDIAIPGLSDIPVIGPIFFDQNIIVYSALIITGLVWWFLAYTRAGRTLRAVGENHHAAHALGYKVRRIRVYAILFGGACAGMGGAYFSLVRVPTWTVGVTAGYGWIALAIVVFASWKPVRALLGAWLFGGITAVQLNIQAADVPDGGGFWAAIIETLKSVPVHVLAMSPYLVTILVLVIMSARDRRGSGAPASLGQSFHASS